MPKSSANLDLALAGYGLGHGAVKKRLEAGEPLPDRTQRFITRVESWLQAFATLPCPRGAAALPSDRTNAAAPGPLCAVDPSRS